MKLFILLGGDFVLSQEVKERRSIEDQRINRNYKIRMRFPQTLGIDIDRM